MELSHLLERAIHIRQLYATLETKQFGRAWTAKDVMLGLVGDVGDLAKLVQAKDGIRVIADVDEKLAHELSDCLWAILVLSRMYDVDLEAKFLETMEILETHIQTHLKDRTAEHVIK